MTAVELLPPSEAVHGNDRWYEIRRAGITASEIAIVLGISPYGSPFSLYWQKVHDWRDDGNEFTSAGRHLEDAIADWWATENPYHVLCPAGLYASSERPWQLATPDRLICDPQMHDNPFPDDPSYKHEHPWQVEALLECKWVAYSWDGWGEPGTDEIPVYYRAQALWQLDTLGVDEVHFAVLGPGGFRVYLVRRDENDLAVMRAAGLAFHQRLESGDAPDLDGHSATITALRKLHPSVGEGDVEVPVELAEEYRHARSQRKAYEEIVDRCEAQIRAALGSEFNRAVCNGKLVASRSVYDQSGDSAELTALEDDWPVVDRLNPGRSASYA
jgi:putative phage-type endonuclease